MYSIPNKKLLTIRKIPRWPADPWHVLPIRNCDPCSEILPFNQILQSRLPPSHFSIHFEAPTDLIYSSNRTNNCTIGRATLLYKSKGAFYLQQQMAFPSMTILELSQRGEVAWLKSREQLNHIPWLEARTLSTYNILYDEIFIQFQILGCLR